MVGDRFGLFTVDYKIHFDKVFEIFRNFLNIRKNIQSMVGDRFGLFTVDCN